MSDKFEIEFKKWLKQQKPDMREDLCSWSAFIGWQAAIDSVVVELPDCSEYDTPRQVIDATKDRLDSAGIKWTE